MSVSHVRFVVQALEGIILEGQPGSALRGALYLALSDSFCTQPDGIQQPDHAETCPVCWLLAREAPNATRGADLPRPLVIEPPPARHYQRGETLTFGISLIGRAQNLFPFVARAVQKMGALGIGVGRGRFKLISIAEYSPLLDAERTLMTDRRVSAPTLQVTPERIADAIRPRDYVLLEFLSPLRLTANNKLVKTPDPRIFIQRLIERCQRLAEYYAEIDLPPTATEWRGLSDTLCQQAATWQIGYDSTQWVEAFSGSRRQGRVTPIGGLVGVVRWDGDVTEAYAWLLWGQSLHVGKDAVKGNGWYRLFA